MSTGRSRGRARTSSRVEPVPVGQPSTSAAQPPVTPVPPLTTTPIVQRVSSPGRSPARGTVLPAETGRGRGIAAESQSTGAAPAAGAGLSPTGSSGSGGSSQESPPQQHSPPNPTTSLGRAALRGAVHQPGVAGVLGPMEKLALQEPGEAGAPRREYRIESVTYTKPESCKTKVGTVGTPIDILCNYFEVLSQPDWVLYQYHVDFAPVVESKRMRIALFKNHDALFPLNKAFDGSTLYSLTKLHDEVTEVSSQRETDQEIIVIKIKRVGEIVPTSPNFVHLFNLVFRRCLRLYGMKQMERNFYDMRQKYPIEQYGLDLINGFSTSIATYENKLLLCAELTHKLLHKTTILQLMGSVYNTSRGDERQFRENCIRELVGRIVMTKYNDKTYKIDEIDWDAKPTSSFNTSRGSITFIDYYKTHYQIDIRDREQPMLVSLPSARDKRRGQNDPILLVPELCIVTGVDERMREDFKFKKAVEQFSKVGPRDRCQRLSKFVSTFNQDEKVQAELQRWQMNFSGRPCELIGKVLPPEVLGFGNNVKKQLNERADWGNDMKGLRLLEPIKLMKWIVVYPQAKQGSAKSFISTYGGIIGSMGIDADRPQEVSIANDSAEAIVNALKQRITDGLQMAVVIVSSKRKDRYDAIKRICCLEKPVPSQVITSAILDDIRKCRSVVTKVAIQMNCKLGGEIWQSNIPLKNLMICGIDTYHDSQKKRSSVCAFIATSNEAKTRYFSRATIQETHQELSNNLTITVKSACEHYNRVNGTYPEKIIIYRDGVSDGQLQLVLEYEIPQIKKAFSMLDPNYNPLLAFIVVKKRGNARFFARFGDRLDNPPCGTIIDTVVTRAEWFDFYLISQCVTQGTVNPTHYNIIYDTIGLPPDRYQKLSFKLTHMYYNWPGTIRVPAPCQYAHKLAFLVGQSLHKEHHSSLCDKLYYL